MIEDKLGFIALEIAAIALISIPCCLFIEVISGDHKIKPRKKGSIV